MGKRTGALPRVLTVAIQVQHSQRALPDGGTIMGAIGWRQASAKLAGAACYATL